LEENWLQKCLEETEMSDKIEFYTTKGPYGCFSNFSRHPVQLDGKTWKTSEHYYQAQKFKGTCHETAILYADNPKEAANIGRDKSLPLREDWEQVKDDVMRKVVLAKFQQHKSLRKVLLSTGDATLIERTDRDSYWGDGPDRQGKNMLGKILMEVRTKLKDYDE
jgi:ribA/ribD-fused uncharacterized protein